ATGGQLESGPVRGDAVTGGPALPGGDRHAAGGEQLEDLRRDILRTLREHRGGDLRGSQGRTGEGGQVRVLQGRGVRGDHGVVEAVELIQLDVRVHLHVADET